MEISEGWEWSTQGSRMRDPGLPPMLSEGAVGTGGNGPFFIVWVTLSLSARRVVAWSLTIAAKQYAVAHSMKELLLIVIKRQSFQVIIVSDQAPDIFGFAQKWFSFTWVVVEQEGAPPIHAPGTKILSIPSEEEIAKIVPPDFMPDYTRTRNENGAALITAAPEQIRQWTAEMAVEMELDVDLAERSDSTDQMMSLHQQGVNIRWLVTDSLTLLRLGLEIPALQGDPPSLWMVSRDKFEARAALRLGASAVIPLDSRFVQGAEDESGTR